MDCIHEKNIKGLVDVQCLSINEEYVSVSVTSPSVLQVGETL